MIFVYVLRFEENFVGTIEADNADEALALAFQRAMKTRHLPLYEAIAFPVEIVGDDKPSPQLRPLSIVSVRGMIAALADYRRTLDDAPDDEERARVRETLTEWFQRYDVSISFIGEKGFE